MLTRKRQVLTANMIIAPMIALNIVMRHGHLLFGVNTSLADEIYLYGDDVCWILLAVLPMLFAKGTERLLSLCLIAIMLSNPVDMAFFTYNRPGINEYIVWTLAPLACVLWWWLGKLRPVLRGDYLLIALIIGMNIYSRNQPDDTLYFKSKALEYFIMSLFVFRQMRHHNKVLPTLFMLLTTANMLQVLYGDPYKPYMYEYILLAYFGLMAAYRYATGRYRQYAYTVRTIKQAWAALNLCLLWAVSYLLWSVLDVPVMQSAAFFAVAAGVLLLLHAGDSSAEA